MVKYCKLFAVTFYTLVASCITTILQSAMANITTNNAPLIQLLSFLLMNMVILMLFHSYCPKSKSIIHVYLGEHEQTPSRCITKVDVINMLINSILSTLMAMLSQILARERFIDSFDPIKWLFFANLIFLFFYLMIKPPITQIIEVKVYDLEANLQSNIAIKISGPACQCKCSKYKECYKPNTSH